jgi:hypothetical protein
MIPLAQRGNLIELFRTNILIGSTGSTYGLFQNNVLPSPTIVLGDLVEADFDGYTRVGGNTDWNTGTDPVSGRPMSALANPNMFYAVTGDANLPQVIYGFFILMDTGALANVTRFKQPLPLTQVGNLVPCPTSFLWNNVFQDSTDAE